MKILLAMTVMALAACTRNVQLAEDIDSPTPQLRLGERWAVIFEGPRVSIALDTASIETLGPQEYRVWLITRYSFERVFMGDRFTAVREFVDYDCPTRRQRIHQSTMLDSGGRTVFHSEYPNPDAARYSPLAPETEAEVRYGAVCSWMGKR